VTSHTVELFGVPGVGKSTLIAPVLALLRDAGVPARVDTAARGSRLAKAMTYARFALTHPRYSLVSAREILGTRQRTRDDLAWVTATWFKRSSRLHRGPGDGGVQLVDAGLLQALWSIGFSGGAADVAAMLARMRPLLPLPEQVVVVRASEAVVARRLAGRPGTQSRLERALDATPDALARAAALVEQIATELGRGSSVEIIEIDADRDDAVAANARRVADAIAAAYRRSSPVAA
jgi:hypothetical protein